MSERVSAVAKVAGAVNQSITTNSSPSQIRTDPLLKSKVDTVDEYFRIEFAINGCIVVVVLWRALSCLWLFGSLALWLSGPAKHADGPPLLCDAAHAG